MSMRMKSTFVLPATILLSVGLSPIFPVKAQDGDPHVKARAIIRTPDGETVIDLDPSMLPNLGEGKHQDELKSIMQERAAKMQEQSKSYTDSRMKALATILRPEQLARLKELDLQYRGPMAMGVNDVATLATLNREQSTAVAAILK